jgi:hypothetical protein
MSQGKLRYDARIVCIKTHKGWRFSKLSKSSAWCMTSIMALRYSWALAMSTMLR